MGDVVIAVSLAIQAFAVAVMGVLAWVVQW